MSVLATCQSRRVDMLMFCDARITSSTNNLFDRGTLLPMKGYYPFYAWSKLPELGTQVSCTVHEGRGKLSSAVGDVLKSELGKPVGSFSAVAAKNANGGGAVIVSRFSDDNNVTETALVSLKVPGVPLLGARCHLTDSVRAYTEVPLEFQPDGSALIRVMPNSFAVMEW